MGRQEAPRPCRVECGLHNFHVIGERAHLPTGAGHRFEEVQILDRSRYISAHHTDAENGYRPTTSSLLREETATSGYPRSDPIRLIVVS